MDKSRSDGLELSEEEIRENFKLLTSRPISPHTVAAGKHVAREAQVHLIRALRLSLLPLRVGNYYLIKAEKLDELFKALDKNGISHPS